MIASAAEASRGVPGADGPVCSLGQVRWTPGLPFLVDMPSWARLSEGTLFAAIQMLVDWDYLAHSAGDEGFLGRS